jgi:predicted aspartyl protease
LNATKGFAAITAPLLLAISIVAAYAVEVPCEIAQGVILVKGEINGRGPQKFILDTGATHNVLTPATAQRLGLIDQVNTDKQLIRRIESLSVGGAVARDPEVFIFDPPQAVSLRLDHGIDYAGILGYPFLSRFVTTIDYQRKVIRFEAAADVNRAQAPSNDRSGLYRLPFQVVDHHVFVKGFVNGKGPLTLLCDTGASETILTGETARAFDFKGVPMEHPAEAAFLADASVSVGSLKADGLPIVLYTPEQARMYGINYHGILGTSFLSRFMVTFDYRSQILTLSRYE